MAVASMLTCKIRLICRLMKTFGTHKLMTAGIKADGFHLICDYFELIIGLKVLNTLSLF